MDRIKKLKIKKQDGTFSDYIPIGADAENIDTTDGESVQLKLNKKPYYYDNVADMKADTKLKAGDMVITSGYYEVNDGGMATYKIREKNTGDVIDEINIIELSNNLVASYINTNYYNGLKYGADPTGTNDSSTAINTAIQKDNYCNLPIGIYKINSTILLDKAHSQLNCEGEIQYFGNDKAILVQNGFVKVNINTLRSKGKGIVLLSISNVIENGATCYGVYNITNLYSLGDCITLDSTNGGIDYNIFKGCLLRGNMFNWDETRENAIGIKIINDTGSWNSRNLFKDYAIVGCDKAIYINGNGGILENCYGNSFVNISFEVNKINLEANQFQQLEMVNCAMTENEHLEKAIKISKFGRGNKVQLTEIRNNKIEVDYTDLGLYAYFEINSPLLSSDGNINGNNVIITKYGCYTTDTQVAPKRINSVTNSTFTGILNSNKFYGYGDSGTFTLPDYIGTGILQLKEFYFIQAANWAGITLKLNDTDQTEVLSIPGAADTKGVYHIIYAPGIGWFKAI